jgi:STAM-binding protein
MQASQTVLCHVRNLIECHVQVQIPEAVAIVMAPTDPKTKCGMFRLSTPGGMDVIRDCSQRGFHAHSPPSSGQEIFELSGHVYLDDSANSRFGSIDLR